MSEVAYRRTRDGAQVLKRYSRRELREAWDASANQVPVQAFQPNYSAWRLEQEHRVVVFRGLDEARALELEAVMLRRAWGDPLTYRHRDQTLAALAPNANSISWYRQLHAAWELAGVDDGGRLFAEDGVEVDAVALVSVVRELASRGAGSTLTSEDLLRLASAVGRK